MTSRAKRSGRQPRQLNPAFAQAHGLGASSSNTVVVEQSSFQRAENAVKRARETGKLNVANAGLSAPLVDILFDLKSGMEVNLSMDTSEPASYECHAEETLTLVNFSDNALGGILDERIDRYRSLRTFRLKRCNLTGIPMKSVQSLANLIILDLESNHLTTFCFDMLPTSIREIDLSFNNLESLLNGESMNVILPNLIKLNISHNNLDDIPSGLECPRLQALDCSANRLSTIPECFLECMAQSLTTLEAHQNCITTAPNLSRFTNLRIVNLSANKLTKIPAITLNLCRLDLSSNQIASLNGLFDDSNDEPSQLVALGIHDNRLVDLDATVVERLVNLKTLDARNNNLVTLPPALGYRSALHCVLLDGNPLRSLGSVDHHDTTALLELLRKRGGNGNVHQEEHTSSLVQEFSTKQASTDDKGIDLSSCLVGTNILKLEGKQLKVMPQSLLNQLKHSTRVAERIQVLKLGKNKLERIDGSIFALLPNMTTLDVDQNCLVELPREFGPLLLSHLSLSQNRLSSKAVASSELGDGLGTPICKTLTHVDLSFNRLEWFPSNIMELNALRVLNLSNNRIASLAVDPMVSSRGWKPGLPALQDLILSDNRIAHLGDFPVTLGATCPLLKTLLLQNNELESIPPQLGMLSNLQAIDLRGNPQRGVRSSILEKGCSDILSYLKNRLTPAELEEYEGKRRAIMNESTAVEATATGAAGAQSCDESREGEQTAQAPTRVDAEPTTSPLAEDLRREIDSLSMQLNHVHLSEAKKYAIKKKLALQKSKLIREERRLREESR